MTTQQNNSDRTSTALIACALITLGALGSATYLYVQYDGLEDAVAQGRLALDNALAEQRTAQTLVLDTRSLLDQAQQRRGGGGRRNWRPGGAPPPRRKDLSLNEARAASLEQTIGRNATQSKELAELRSTAQGLRDQLALALELELDLRMAADKAKADRDLLAHQLDEREVGASMVNNAELTALRGKKGKLTVKARRTNEVYMAFDLPGSLASGAHFTMTSPKGKQYSSAEPVVSASRHRSDATASVGLVAKPDAANTSHVDLKFRPTEKMQPGIYRIEVRSGKDYLQTVFLSLR
ncbi:MAG: hypothetical protein IPH05_10825 [Flavobacteriales bacterium]|nr:hypothetical protein [Flavobacteriales bacterium]